MMRYWNYGPGYFSMDSGFSILGMILMVLFWGLVIMLVVKLVRSIGCHHHEEVEEAAQDRSLGIAKERYAKGEIDKKEFEQLKKDLA